MSEVPTVPFKKYKDLQIATDNMDAERCYLRERLREKQELLQKALMLVQEAVDIPQHYEGQNNKYELPAPVSITSIDPALDFRVVAG